MIRTALIRRRGGALAVTRDDFYRSNKEYAEDLRGNGYKVLKIWNGYKTNEEVDEWEFLNRK